MSGNEADQILQAIGTVISFLYGMLGIVSNAFWRSMWWLWTATPMTWPIWAKLAIYPFALALLVVPQRLWQWWRGMPKVFGDARFATLKDLKKSDMLVPGGRYLGQFQQKRIMQPKKAHDLFSHGEKITITIAAQGSGKTTGLIIPTLLTYLAGSVVVTDPKGAITAQTSRFRQGMSRVVVLNPWRLELLEDPAFGVDLGDTGFNPLLGIDPTPNGRATAGKIAALLVPDMPGETNPYFRTEARELLAWCLLWMSIVIPDPEDRTLPLLHSFVYDTVELTRLLKLHSADETKGQGREALRLSASKYYHMFKTAPAQFTGVIGTLTTALNIYEGDSYLGQHVSKRNGFRLADIKGAEKLTIYIICPPSHLVGDDRKWLNLVLASIAQEIGKPGFAREIVLLMDEFPALGYLPNLASSIEQFREAGLRVHLIAQNPGQIVTTYKAEGLSRLWGCCDTKQFFRITDPNHAKELSEWLGQRQEMTLSRNPQGELTWSLVGVPLIRPEELTGMANGRQVIHQPGMPPIWGQIVPYYKRPEWAALVDPNPYRQARPHGARQGTGPGPAAPAGNPYDTAEKTRKQAQTVDLSKQKTADETHETVLQNDGGLGL